MSDEKATETKPPRKQRKWRVAVYFPNEDVVVYEHVTNLYQQYGIVATPDEIRKSIRLTRQAAGLTQEEVGRKAVLNHSKLSLYENGLIDLTSDELRRVKKILNAASKKTKLVTLRDLLGSDPPPKPKPLDLQVAPRLRRQQAGLSQRELARAAMISRTKLIKFEAEELRLTPEEEERWFDALIQADPYLQLALYLWGD